MKHSLLPLSILLSTLIAACGGNVSGADDNSGTAGTGGTAGAGGSGGAAGSAGSAGNAGSGGSGGTSALNGTWNLQITEVTVSTGFPSNTPASTGKTAQLDLRPLADGSYEAAFTPRFGTPSLFKGTIKNSALVLAGSAFIQEGQTCMASSETWNEVQIALGTDGQPSGTATLTGTGMYISGDVGSGGDATGKGKVGKDKEPPTFSSNHASVLPWQEFVLTSSEFVDQNEFLKNLSKVDNLDWSISPVDPTVGWAGVLQASGSLKAFPTANTALKVGVVAGMHDRSGNVAQAFENKHEVLGIGLGYAGFDLDTDASPLLVSYGTEAPAYFGQKQGYDARCEKGGCMQLGPVEPYSGKSTGAVAGRLLTAGGTKLRIRYRLMMGYSPYGGGSEPPQFYGPVFTITTASPGQKAVSESVSGPLTFKPQLAVDPTFPWTTDWLTAAFPINPGEVGFAIDFTRQNTQYCMPGPMASPMALMIDRIEVM